MTKETIYKIIGAVCACIMAIAAAIFGTSCSSTRASILTAKDSSTTTISITTNNPVSAETKVDAQTEFLNK